ncbi:MAG: peptide deformylase [bacterium]|nr:peptide deformylase [bacterium]
MAVKADSEAEEILPGRAIRRYGNACLRVTCQPVPVSARGVSPDVVALVKRLWRILGVDGGVGLAAPQVGIDLNVVVVRDPEAATAKSRTTMINPEIVETFGPEVFFEEGCLSFPGLFHDVARPRGIVVNFTDESGHSHQIRNDKMFARIVQHEVDHLNGVLFVDHLPFTKKVWLLPRLIMQRVGHLIWKLRNGK